jgi:hypothetical protein
LVAQTPDEDDELEAVPTVDAEARRKLDRALRDRISIRETDGPWPGVWSGGACVPIPPEDLPVARLVRWVLADYLGAPDLGRDEKIAWQLRFRFDGRPCTMALQKFGLRLYLDPAGLEGHGVTTAVADIVATLQKATEVAVTSVLRRHTKSQEKRVTVSNQYYRLRRMYDYFRELAENPILPFDESEEEGIVAPTLKRLVRTEELRFFNGVAMVNAYFSWLEHTLVLVWPFVKYQPDIHNLEQFVAYRWTEKFKAVFDIPTDSAAKRVYDQLRDLAEEYRNTYAHGGFGKERATLLVHMPNGPLPANLSDVRERQPLQFFPIPEPSLSAITDVLDDVDAWLRVGPAQYGMMYAESGLDLPFNRSSVTKYQEAMRSREEFDDFLMRTSEMVDRMSNMDW